MTIVNPFLNIVRAVTSPQQRTPRRSPRLPVKSTALLHTDDQPSVPVALRNISVGGASMTSHLRLRHNDRIRLTIHLPQNERLDVDACVVHTGEKGSGFKCQYGLKFLNVSEDAYRRLAKFIHDPKNGWQFDATPPPWDSKPA
jgi:c-di-GMP-binding flagellar brake protein YcgR